MIRGRSKRCKAKPLLIAETELCGPTPGARGHTVKIGSVMSRPPFYSDTWGLVARVTGKVTRLYKREDAHPNRILAELRGQCGNTHTVPASLLRRSRATLEQA